MQKSNTCGLVAGHGRDRGATAIEYALIASLIAGFIVAVVSLVGVDTLALWQEVDW